LKAVINLDPDSSESIEAQREVGLKFSQKICNRVQELGFKGIHLMAIGQEANLAEILKRIMPLTSCKA
jgi:5,10-methylenetetrahydrofolate reductase